MNKHTAGPWKVSANRRVIQNAAGESIASSGNNRAVTGEELEASLVLAAAAPDLLAALEAIREITQDATGICMEIDAIASAAIKKARGEA